MPTLQITELFPFLTIVFQLSVENVKRFSLVNSTIAYLPSEGERMVFMKCPEREQRWRGTIDKRGQCVTRAVCIGR